MHSLLSHPSLMDCRRLFLRDYEVRGDEYAVVVTHDLASIFAIGTNSIFLDADRKTISAQGPPKELLAHTQDPRLRSFLTRGGAEHS